VIRIRDLGEDVDFAYEEIDLTELIKSEEQSEITEDVKSEQNSQDSENSQEELMTYDNNSELESNHATHQTSQSEIVEEEPTEEEIKASM